MRFADNVMADPDPDASRVFITCVLKGRHELQLRSLACQLCWTIRSTICSKKINWVNDGKYALESKNALETLQSATSKVVGTAQRGDSNYWN
jgi:hypothetical protein